MFLKIKIETKEVILVANFIYFLFTFYFFRKIHSYFERSSCKISNSNICVTNLSLIKYSYSLQDVVPYEREFKRWAGDTSASTWRDTKMYVSE